MSTQSTDFIQGSGDGATSTKDFEGGQTTDRGNVLPQLFDYVAQQFQISDLTYFSGSVYSAPGPYMVEVLYATDEPNSALIPPQPTPGTQIQQTHWLRNPVAGNQLNAVLKFSANTELGTAISVTLPSPSTDYDSLVTTPNGGLSADIATPAWLQKAGTYNMVFGASIGSGVTPTSGGQSCPIAGSTVKIYYISRAGATLVGTVNDALVLDVAPGGTFTFAPTTAGFFRFVFSNLGIIGPNATTSPSNGNYWSFALESTGYTP